MSKPDLQLQLQSALPQLEDEDFDYHATDLYVRAYPEVISWLTYNYQHVRNVTRFVSQTSYVSTGDLKLADIWLDIPFAGNWPQSPLT